MHAEQGQTVGPPVAASAAGFLGIFYTRPVVAAVVAARVVIATIAMAHFTWMAAVSRFAAFMTARVVVCASAVTRPARVVAGIVACAVTWVITLGPQITAFVTARIVFPAGSVTHCAWMCRIAVHGQTVGPPSAASVAGAEPYH